MGASCPWRHRVDRVAALSPLEAAISRLRVGSSRTSGRCSRPGRPWRAQGKRSKSGKPKAFQTTPEKFPAAPQRRGRFPATSPRCPPAGLAATSEAGLPSCAAARRPMVRRSPGDHRPRSNPYRFFAMAHRRDLPGSDLRVPLGRIVKIPARYPLCSCKPQEVLVMAPGTGRV